MRRAAVVERREAKCVLRECVVAVLGSDFVIEEMHHSAYAHTPGCLRHMMRSGW